MTRVLVVEDSPTQAEMLAQELREEGYETAVAKSAEQALADLAASDFDIVVSDIVMPGLSGYDLCRRIKDDPTKRDVPVILVTTQKRPSDILEGLSCGADSFLVKPVNPDQLFQRMRLLLGNRASFAESKFSMGVRLNFLGTSFTVTAEREQILNLLITTLEDIEETNQALRESQAELATAMRKLEDYAGGLEVQHGLIVDNAADGILTVNESGRVEAINPAALEIFGYERSEVLGRSVDMLMSAAQQDSLTRAIRDHLKSGESRFIGRGACELTGRYKKGRPIPLEITVSEMAVEGSRKFIVIIRDISHLKRIEQRLRLLLDINEAMSGEGDVVDVLRRALKFLCEFTGWEYGDVWLPNVRSGLLEFGAAWPGDSGRYAGLADAAGGVRFARNMGMPGRVWATKTAEWESDMTMLSGREYVRRDSFLRLGLRGACGIPIPDDRGEVLAVLIFVWKEAQEENGELIESLNSVAPQIGAIFQRKMAEASLRQSEERFRALLESTNMGIFVHRDFTPVFANPAAASIFGYDSPEKLLEIGSYLALYPPETQEFLKGHHASRKRGEAIPEDIEVRALKADGGEIWLKSRATFIPWDGDRALCVMMTDSTESRNRDEALRRHEEQVSLLLESAGEGIYAVDANGTCTLCNPAAARLLGYGDPDALIGRHGMHDVVHHTRPDGTPYPVKECPIFRAIQQGEGVVIDDEILWRKDGTSFPAEMRSFPIRRDGAVIGASVTFDDITERKQLETELRQSQKMEAVGQLTGGVAHDFNNLLTVILGNVQLLGKKLEGNDDLARRVSTIERAAQRGAALTRQLLAFSRRQELSPETVEFGAILLEMRDMLGSTMGETIELSILPHESPWPARVDRSQLENAILNLCVNARDAMPRGGRLTLETDNVHLDATYAARHAEVSAGDYAMVAVTDTGTGIPRDILGRVFEPFFTTKETGKGTGLGLSMVYGFVKQSGGHAKVYSEVGHGTTVKLYFPRTSHEAVAADSDEADTAQDSDDRIVILAVEDDEDVRETAVALLESMGHRVITADDGRAALAVLASGTPIDLLFTDVVMPGGMLGTELAEQARSRWPHLKVLFTSGYTRRAMHDNGKLPEGAHMIAKPYAAVDLAQKIKEIISHGSE